VEFCLSKPISKMTMSLMFFPAENITQKIFWGWSRDGGSGECTGNALTTFIQNQETSKKEKKNLLKKQSQQKLSQSVKYSLSSHHLNVGCAPIVRVLHTFSCVQPCPGPWMTGC
jgi:hypothetical protein